jgi:hypothetical protein
MKTKKRLKKRQNHSTTLKNQDHTKARPEQRYRHLNIYSISIPSIPASPSISNFYPGGGFLDSLQSIAWGHKKQKTSVCCSLFFFFFLFNYWGFTHLSSFFKKFCRLPGGQPPARPVPYKYHHFYSGEVFGTGGEFIGQKDLKQIVFFF